MRTVNVNNFYFFRTNQFSTKFRRNSTNFRPIVVVGETSQSAKRRIDQMSHSTKRRFDEMVFDQMSWTRCQFVVGLLTAVVGCLRLLSVVDGCCRLWTVVVGKYEDPNFTSLITQEDSTDTYKTSLLSTMILGPYTGSEKCMFIFIHEGFLHYWRCPVLHVIYTTAL